jgi:hypothetical protein
MEILIRDEKGRHQIYKLKIIFQLVDWIRLSIGRENLSTRYINIDHLIEFGTKNHSKKERFKR